MEIPRGTRGPVLGSFGLKILMRTNVSTCILSCLSISLYKWLIRETRAGINIDEASQFPEHF